LLEGGREGGREGGSKGAAATLPVKQGGGREGVPQGFDEGPVAFVVQQGPHVSRSDVGVACREGGKEGGREEEMRDGGDGE